MRVEDYIAAVVDIRAENEWNARCEEEESDRNHDRYEINWSNFLEY